MEPNEIVLYDRPFWKFVSPGQFWLTVVLAVMLVFLAVTNMFEGDFKLALADLSLACIWPLWTDEQNTKLRFAAAAIHYEQFVPYGQSFNVKQWRL